MDWSTDSFIDLLIGSTYRWVVTISRSSAVCLCTVRQAVSCRSDWEEEAGGRGGERGLVRGHILKQGVQSEGRWREKGGRFGQIGRLGASVRREESWEVQWWSNFCHHWTTQQSPSQWFYSHHAWSHDPRAWCRHRGQTTERQQRHQLTYYYCCWVFFCLSYECL